MREDEILNAALKMVNDGATFLDIGGYSSRPGAAEVSVDEEKKRVLPVIKLIAREVKDAIISVDTFRSEVALEAVDHCGAHIINDISGGEGDPEMYAAVSRLEVPYILMHMRGTPATMQDNPVYKDIIADILKWFAPRIEKLYEKGAKDIIIDPGFGFGKTTAHNLEMVNRFQEFRIAGLPLLAGVSRKSMIWKTLNGNPESALAGTIAIQTVLLEKGASIIRTHDVKEAYESIIMLNGVSDSGKTN
jgi:dihydropteroate synthase